MKQRGKLSVALAIIKALKDIQHYCEYFGGVNSFQWGMFTVRLRAYIGTDYRPADAMIKRRMRKIQAKGYKHPDGSKTHLSYKRGRNGIYTFKIK